MEVQYDTIGSFGSNPHDRSVMRESLDCNRQRIRRCPSLVSVHGVWYHVLHRPNVRHLLAHPSHQRRVRCSLERISTEEKAFSGNP